MTLPIRKVLEIRAKDNTTLTAEWIDDSDYVEVVRCQDCKHYVSDGGALMECGVLGIIVHDNDYCSFGEVAEGE